MTVTVDTLMTGAAMRPVSFFDNTNDPVQSLVMVANVAYNLRLHRHISGEGTQIPPAGLTGDVLKKMLYFASSLEVG